MAFGAIEEFPTPTYVFLQNQANRRPGDWQATKVKFAGGIDRDIWRRPRCCCRFRRRDEEGRRVQPSPARFNRRRSYKTPRGTGTAVLDATRWVQLRTGRSVEGLAAESSTRASRRVTAGQKQAAFSEFRNGARIAAFRKAGNESCVIGILAGFVLAVTCLWRKAMCSECELRFGRCFMQR
jgi:hypothetical protein